MHGLFSNGQVAALILANNKEVRADFVEHADRLAVPLFSTPLAGPVVTACHTTRRIYGSTGNGCFHYG